MRSCRMLHFLRGACAELHLAAGDLSPLKRAKHEVDDDTGSARSSRGWTVSPAQLREALSKINHAAIHFELSEMHDAAEVSFICSYEATHLPGSSSVHASKLRLPLAL